MHQVSCAWESCPLSLVQPCQLRTVCLLQGGTVGEDVSSRKPCLIIKDESAASCQGFCLSHPPDFTETGEQAGKSRLHQGQKVIVTGTFLTKSVFPALSLPSFCSQIV